MLAQDKLEKYVIVMWSVPQGLGISLTHQSLDIYTQQKKKVSTFQDQIFHTKL